MSSSSFGRPLSGLAERGPKPLEVRPAHRQHPVDRSLESHLPVGLGVAAPDLRDPADVHGVIPVDAQHAGGGQDGTDLPERAHVPERACGSQADECRLAGRLEEVDVVRLDRAATSRPRWSRMRPFEALMDSLLP